MFISKASSDRRSLFLFHQPQNHLWCNAHLSNRTKTSPHILYAGAQQIDFVVDNQETVMIAVLQLDELYFGILGVVLLQVGEELFIMPGVDGRRNTIGSFGEHGEYSVVNIVVNQDNPLSGASNEI